MTTRPLDALSLLVSALASARFAQISLLIPGTRRWHEPKHFRSNASQLAPLIERHKVRVTVDSGAVAISASLAENLMREEMHPIDQFEAFKPLNDEYVSIADIAARFGTAATICRRRLALASVAPALPGLYCNEQMSLEQTVRLFHKRRP